MQIRKAHVKVRQKIDEKVIALIKSKTQAIDVSSKKFCIFYIKNPQRWNSPAISIFNPLFTLPPEVNIMQNWALS